MIQAYEIPKGTNLYFGKTASQKRQIENLCADFLSQNGFQEILTPFFSHHQTLDPKELINLSDDKNHPMALRADSTLELVRIVEQRLSRTTLNQKWFYIQPVFNYPSIEINQIGAEWIGADLGEKGFSYMLDLVANLLEKLGIKACLQVGNLALPKIVAKELNLPLDLMINHELDELEKLQISWLSELIKASNSKDLQVIKAPSSVKAEIKRLIDIYDTIKWADKTISPLYYTKLQYYDNLFFRFIKNTNKYAMGGAYKTGSNQNAVGFALYTDDILRGTNK